MKKDQKITFSKKVKRQLFKMGIISALITVACGFVYKTITRIRTNKFDKLNKDNPIRRYTSFIEDRLIVPASGIIEGISLTSLMASVTLDLRGCEFSDNAFITLRSTASAIRIIVPSGINFKFDGMIKKSSIDNKASDDSLAKTVYIASRICATAIVINPAE